MILRVGGTLVLATLLTLAAVTGAQAKGKPAKATKLAVSMPATATAGEGVDIKLSAISRQGKPVRSFSGTLRATSSSAATTLPAKAKLVKGQATLRGVEFQRAGAVKVAFTGQIKGSARTQVAAGELTDLKISAPDSAIAGEHFAVDASGQDRLGNAVDADPAFSILPSGSCDATGCSTPRAGTFTVLADAGPVHAERTVEVSRGTVASIAIEAPTTVAAGEVFKPTAKALDAQGRELADQSDVIAFSLSSGDCRVGGCSTTRAGTVKVMAQVDGVSSERGINVTPGVAKSLELTPKNGLSLAPAMPSGANADYAPGSYPYAKSISFSVDATDAYGNAVDTGGVTLNAPGVSCSGLTCTGVEPGYPTLTAQLGDATTTKRLQVAGFAEAYYMTCRGENYDLNKSLTDGCEFAQPDPGHTTMDGATDLGRFTSCADDRSQFSFSGTHARDPRKHTGVEGFDTEYKGAPLFWKVQAGSGFCTNDVYLKLEGNSDDRACLSVVVRGADNRLIDRKTLSDNGAVELQTGSGAYRDNEVLTFAIEASCWGSSTTNKTDFTVSGHL